MPAHIDVGLGAADGCSAHSCHGRRAEKWRLGSAERQSAQRNDFQYSHDQLPARLTEHAEQTLAIGRSQAEGLGSYKGSLIVDISSSGVG
jgi:hypothetical protein